MKLFQVDHALVPAVWNLQKLIMISNFRNGSLVKHGNHISIAHSGQAMGNHNCGTTLARLVKRFLHHAFGFRVQCRGGFVKKQNFRVAHQGTSNSNTLLLTSRQQSATLTQHGVITLRELGNKVVRVGLLGCLHDGFKRNLSHDKALFTRHRIHNHFKASTELNVLANRRCEQGGHLTHQPDLTSEGLYIDLANIHAIQEHATFQHVVESLHELDCGRLAAT
mmetsp:Transcript_13835/g.23611  ORF Transcript_13835/g.23611 Transcript_13835/m.23611 type:complete len:222 (-) Transcript_13835:2927-3592(-)